VIYRRPLHEVKAWPARDLTVLAQYLAERPAPEERIEYAVAYLHADYLNAQRKPGTPARSISDVMLFREPAPDATDDRYNDVDRSIIKALMSSP
jgi:hypothetical protein